MVLGPGGSGVSAVAAAGALGRARTAHRAVPPLGRPDRHTLLITADRWSPTAEMLGVFSVPDEPVAVSSGLHLLTLDRLTAVESAWSAFTAVLGLGVRTSKSATAAVTALIGIDAAELTALPGVEDFLLLRRIRDEATGGSWERIVVDLSGVADPYALLRAPTVFGQALERLWPRHRRLAAASEKSASAQVGAALETIARDCDDITELLGDPSVIAVHLLATPDARGARLMHRHLALADLMGLPVRSVIVNEGVRSGDGAELPAVDDPDVTMVGVAASPLPLDRPARLRKLGVSLAEPDGRPRGSGAAHVVQTSADGLDSTFELSWRQRLPDPQRFGLGRSGDDLLVTVDGFRHAVRLPSVLRRCQVSDAQWDGTRLSVGFRPDPAVWPRGGRT
ncbi:ArsA family ATPase [Gordonia desulfuricans]|uniref:ArsA family ATPase n=1 Tax=Gordonia desulfuricans TaxID=89051 RepID=A0A7K3LNC7_9ACTN|nr:ArsA-related P-loop ATPase [Gordonia desulfuricans]NDK89678.1 ArsA family ATPase [Gordonia desulfuricans]